MFMLGVGIDWAEEFHDVALGRPGDGVFDEVHVDHTPAALDALIARIVALEPDPAEVRVVIETRHGLLVERLVDAGFTVLPVNPDLIARRRGPAKKKDDAEDARIACLLALDRFTDLRALVPHGAPAGELRAIARDDVRAQRDARRLLNRLRADLLATFPAAMIIAGDDLGAPTLLKLLQRWPSADTLAAAPRDEYRGVRSHLPPWLARPLRRPRPSRTRRRPAHRQALPRACQGRHHPPGRRPAAAHPHPTPRLGETHGRAAARSTPRRAKQPARRRPGAGGPWRRDLPELSRPR